MGLLKQKSRVGRLADSLPTPRRKSSIARAVKPRADSPLPAAVRTGLANPPKGVKPGLAAVGGVIGLTAGSAAVSALRRRSEGSANGS